MTTNTFYDALMRTSHNRRRTTAKRVIAAVFHALRDRLTPEEADQVVAQLPRELKDIWLDGEAAERQPVKMGRQEFYARVDREAGLTTTAQARWNTLAVFAALKEQLTPGEAEDVMAQLPKDLKEDWTEAQGEV
jgi:uncharacterized protein (DUF2267 family)